MFAGWRRLILITIIGLGAGALFLVIFAHSIVLQKLQVPNQDGLVTVESGEGLIALNHKLAEEGLINNARHMYWWARLARLPTALKVGSYQVDSGVSYKELINKIVDGRSRQYAITVLPGDRFSDFYNDLINHPHLQHTLVNMTIGNIMTRLDSDYRHPEGLFYADTYYFYSGEKDFNVLKIAYDKLMRVLEQAWSNRSEGLVYRNPYEALVLASIVEKETGLAEERPLIAGVFHNRLVKGMRLQADPTIIYGMGDSFLGDIRRKDIRAATPYNTYVIYGLPPTPIALVDEQAITAALNPQPSDYFFFVAKADGSRSHYFSATWEEHRKAVELYQLRRR